MERFRKSEISSSTEAPSGMNVIFADKYNSYGSRYIPDVIYRTVDSTDLKLQLLLPYVNIGKNGYPLLVYIQGSAWRKQDIYSNIPQLCHFANNGYAVASIEYRPSDAARFPAQIIDVKAAIRYLRAKCGEYNIDSDRIAIFGDSSGGHTALMTGLTYGEKIFDEGSYLDESSEVNAIIDFYGPTDIAQMFSFPRANWAVNLPVNEVPENILFGGDVKLNPEIAQSGNPLNYVTADRKIPPVLIMHGDEDDVVPFNQSVIMYNKLIECQKNVQFYKIMGAFHGDRMWTKQVLDIVVAFLKAYV